MPTMKVSASAVVLWIALVVAATTSTAAAFTPPTSRTASSPASSSSSPSSWVQQRNRLSFSTRFVAGTTLPDVPVPDSPTTPSTTKSSSIEDPAEPNGDSNKKDQTPWSPRRLMNRQGLALSGMQGQALDWDDDAYPTAAQLRSVIPKDCFQSETWKSLTSLTISAVATAVCTAGGMALLTVCNPANLWTWPLWSAYAAVTGTVALGLWVLAHECGHGAFSPNKQLQDAVGYTLHSLMLVPYYSWQRSHAVHHQYTNHMELGETHVPKESSKSGASDARQVLCNALGPRNGLRVWGIAQLFMHLVVGWPAYLLVGATGGHDRGMTNHFFPNPLTTPNQPKKELFPGKWKDKVLKSDIGIAVVVLGLVCWAAARGIPEVMALYGGPLLVVNAWLVLYTWLQHTDTDVPHFSEDNHSFVKGALHTIDRPYDKLDPWGLIDFLHHKIGSTHVAHHFDSTIPHYKAYAATKAIRENFPRYYLYDPTPIPQATWRIARGCATTEKRDNRWVWINDGMEKYLQE